MVYVGEIERGGRSLLCLRGFGLRILMSIDVLGLLLR